MLFLFLYLMPTLTSLGQPGGIPEHAYFRLFHTVFALQIVAIILSLALIAGFLIYLFRTTRVPADKRSLWAVVLLLGGIVGMPVFWYLYVWRQPEGAA